MTPAWNRFAGGGSGRDRILGLVRESTLSFRAAPGVRVGRVGGVPGRGAALQDHACRAGPNVCWGRRRGPRRARPASDLAGVPASLAGKDVHRWRGCVRCGRSGSGSGFLGDETNIRYYWLGHRRLARSTTARASPPDHPSPRLLPPLPHRCGLRTHWFLLPSQGRAGSPRRPPAESR